MKRALRVAALTLGRVTPSARFRVRQFIPGLAEAGVEIVEHFPAERRPQTLAKGRVLRATQLVMGLARASWARGPDVLATHRYDATWLSKQLVVGLPTWETVVRRPLVLDVDDAMWLARPWGEVAAARAARAAYAVTVGNSYLREWYARHNPNVHLVPTSIDTERFVPSEGPEQFTIGWTGSRATLPYLENIAPALDAFFSIHPEARLRVICDAPPRFAGRTSGHVDFVPWCAEAELSGLSNLSVGIMPLTDDPISRGKCSFKMLQYMACGLPVVVSPVGSNADILRSGNVGWAAATMDDWVDALKVCVAEPARARQRGREGRLLVERDYSLRATTLKLIEVFEPLSRSAP